MAINEISLFNDYPHSVLVSEGVAKKIKEIHQKINEGMDPLTILMEYGTNDFLLGLATQNESYIIDPSEDPQSPGS